MSIYQKADGTWGVEFRDEWGRRKKKSVGSQAAAAAVEEQIRRHAAEQRRAIRTFQTSENLSISDAREIYIAQVTATTDTKSHMRQRLSLFERYLGQSQLNQVTTQLLHTWVERRSPMLSAQTLWRDVKMLRAWFTWMHSKFMIAANPAATLQTPKPAESSARSITYQEETRLLACLEPNTALRCILSLDAGLALGEIVKLRRNHIDFHRKVLAVLEVTKRHNTREVPLTRRLESELRRQLGNAPPDTHVCSRSGRPVKERSANKFMPGARARMGGASFRFHDLRHTFATRLAASGASVFTVAALTGHHLYRWATNRHGEPILTTLREYVHPDPTDLRTAIEKMEAANPNCRPPATENRKENPCQENASPMS